MTTRSVCKQCKADNLDKVLGYAVDGIVVAALLLPQLALAAGASGVMTGVTEFLKTIVNLLIFEWGYYIGIATLAIQGYRYWTGHTTMMELGKWGLGVALVFFAPNIVQQFRQGASGTV
jgi:type IV secretion system protein VirB2